MIEWYVPITILPGICLLILSTSNIMLDLSREISKLINSQSDKKIIIRKLDPLKLVNRSMVFLYSSVACFVISGLLGGIEVTILPKVNLPIFIMIPGMLLSTFAICGIIVYSFRSVKIRQDQHRL